MCVYLSYRIILVAVDVFLSMTLFLFQMNCTIVSGFRKPPLRVWTAFHFYLTV